MIDVTFYNFSKSPKSTKIVNTTGVTFQCELIENTSIISPVIRLKTDFATIGNKNYVYIPVFERYYFITNVVYTLGLWDISLEEDVLASNKTTIGASTQYVTRASSEYDETIIDSAYPTKTNLLRGGTTEMYGHNIFGDSVVVWYVIGIIGGVTGIDAQIRDKVYNGSVVYYCCTSEQFQYLMGYMMSNVDLFQIPTSEISQQLQKQLIDPLQYIESIRILPFEPEEKYETAYINFGFNTFDLTNDFHMPSGQKIYILRTFDLTKVALDNGYVNSYDTVIQLAMHPDYETRGSWLLSDPYSKYVLKIPIWGEIELHTSILRSSAIIYFVDGVHYILLNIRTMYDVSTGKCTIRLSVDNKNTWFYEETRDLTVNIPFHQTVQNVQGFEQAHLNLGNLASNTLTGYVKDIFNLDLGSAITRGTSTIQRADSLIQDAQNANQVKVSGNGAMGAIYSFHRLYTSPRVDWYFQRFVDEYITDKGRPLFKPRTINTLSGYVQCQNANFASSAFKEENDTIINYMNGGFFYE